MIQPSQCKNTRRRNTIRCWSVVLAGCLLTIALPPRCLAEEYVKTQTLGPVQVTLKLDSIDPTIGDQVTLTLAASAESGVELLMPEFGEVLSNFTVSEFIPKRNVNPDGSLDYVQVYRFQVTTSGEKSIRPILIEFVDNRPGKQPAPEDYDAYEILTERVDFQVKSVLPQGATEELAPPLPELELPKDRTSSTLFTLTPILLAAAVLTAVFWFRRKSRKRVRKVNAYEVAHERLQRLLQQQSDTTDGVSTEHFFVEISAIIRQYLEDRFDIRAPELTTDEFLQLASQGQALTTAHQVLLGEFLKQADAVKFAGVRASASDMEHSSQLAKRFLDETRANAPDKIVSETTEQASSEPEMDSAEARKEEPSDV